MIVGVVGATIATYVYVSVEIKSVRDELDQSQKRPFVTFAGHVPGGEMGVTAKVVVPDGQNALVMVSANAFGVSMSKEWRTTIVATIEVDGNTVARSHV